MVMKLIFALVLCINTLSTFNLAYAEAPNVLLICIDDLRPELNCYGVDYIQSPHIDAIASQGLVFNHHYVQAPTCGASRYTLLTGTYGSYGNSGLFKRAKKIAADPASVSPSLPAWFKQHGYHTVSIGKVSHHPGGFGGKNWDNESDLEMPLSWTRSLMPSGAWQHPRGAMHGLANGQIRVKAKDMAVYEAVDGADDIYPDGLITDGAIAELTTLAEADTPFFLAVGIIRPHLPFGAPAKYLEPYREAELPPIPFPEPHPEVKLGSSEFMKYKRWDRNPKEDPEFALEVRRYYAACVTYADAQVGRIMAHLRQLGLDDKTIVVVWGDHGWNLGEHAHWGKHCLFEESLRAPLIIRPPQAANPGTHTDAVVETIDIYPTLCELANLPLPENLDGTSLVAQLDNPASAGRHAISYTGSDRTIRSPTHRLTVSKNKVRLYDHRSPAKETQNVSAAHPEIVEQLSAILDQRYPR